MPEVWKALGIRFIVSIFNFVLGQYSFKSEWIYYRISYYTKNWPFPIEFEIFCHLGVLAKQHFVYFYVRNMVPIK